MRQAWLVSVAALALAAAMTTASFAQKEGGSPGASGMSAPAGTNAPAANPSGTAGPRTGAPGAAQTEPSESPAPKATAPGGNRGAQDRRIPEKQKSTEQPPGGTGATQGAGTSDRALTSRNVSLTTEQKSTIRSKVLTNAAPRLEGSADFDVKIGAVVPRTVRVSPVPATIVEIEPAWRGFMYFVRGDEIVIVDPHTLEIVAVLDV
jgi:hypothetical protein